MYGSMVARAYITYFPLLLENKAITSYVIQMNQHSIREMMPEILTAEEAVLMATKEFGLTKLEQKNLFNLLIQAQKQVS